MEIRDSVLTGQDGQLRLKSFKFSAGETQVQVGTNGRKSATLSTRIRSGDDVMELLMVIDALAAQGIDSRNIDLMLGYLPYARQDRRMQDGESFSLKVFCDLINSQNLKNVYVLDPHSDVGPALLNNCIQRDWTHFVYRAFQALNLKDDSRTVLVSPDAGSYKKISKLTGFDDSVETVIATKKRDVTTGKLTDVQVLGDVTGKCCVIIDDICDGGRTFVNLANALRDAGAAEVYLVVTHGIFSNGLNDLMNVLDGICTTDTMAPRVQMPKHDKLKVIPSFFYSDY